jgi:hypothetical protein
MIPLFRQEWKVTLAFGVIGIVAIVEPNWAFNAIRFCSAGVYALLLAASSW